jgi:hypothetical protein
MGVAAERLQFGIGDTVEHMKTGNLYFIIGFGKQESTLEEMVIYIAATKNGPLNNSMPWIRPKKEFYDGRFLKTYY